MSVIDDTIELPRREIKAIESNPSPESDSLQMSKPEEIKVAGCDFNSSNYKDSELYKRITDKNQYAETVEHLDEIMRQKPDYFKELCSWNKSRYGPISSEDFRQIIAIEYGKLSGKSGTVARDEAAASARKLNTEILSEENINSQRVALTNLLHRIFPQNVKIEQKTMTLSKNCGFGGNLFCCKNLSKFTNNFVRIVGQFFSENNGKYDGPDPLFTLSDLFDEIRIKSNFFELRCLNQQQKQSLEAIIGINIRKEQKEQTGGSHSRRKRHASKKSRKSHRRHRRSTRNKKRHMKHHTKHHTKRHTKQYRHRK